VIKIIGRNQDYK